MPTILLVLLFTLFAALQPACADNKDLIARCTRQLAASLDHSGQTTADNTSPKSIKITDTMANAPAFPRHSYSGESISLHKENAGIRTVLMEFQSFSPYPIILADSIHDETKATIHLNNVAWDKALDIIIKEAGLEKREIENVIYLAKQEELQLSEPRHTPPIITYRQNRSPVAIAIPDAHLAFMGHSRYGHKQPIYHNSRIMQKTAENPLSAQSIKPIRDNYQIARYYLQKGDIDTARQYAQNISFLNALTYDYPLPDDGKLFSLDSAVIDSPWHTNNKFLRIAVQAANPLPTAVHLVFIIPQNNDWLIPETICHFVSHMQGNDTFAIIRYGKAIETLLPPTPISTFNPADLPDAIPLTDESHSLISAAYAMTARTTKNNAINRLILLADASFIEGKDYQQAEISVQPENITFTLLNMNKDTRHNPFHLHALANNKKGDYALLYDQEDIADIVSRQLGSLQQPIARSAFIQVEFNPATVASYKRIDAEEFTDHNNGDNDTVLNGQQYTTLYEITPSQERLPNTQTEEYAIVNLSYQSWQSGLRHTDTHMIPARTIPFTDADDNTRSAVMALAFVRALRDEITPAAWHTILTTFAQHTASNGESMKMLQLMHKLPLDKPASHP